MHHQQQRMTRWSELEQARVKQRPLLQVEGLPRLLNHQPRRLSLSFLFAHMTEISDGDSHRQIRRDDLPWLFILDGARGTQRFMTSDDSIERAFEGGRASCRE